MIKGNELRLGNFVKDRGEKTIRIDVIEYVRNRYHTKFGQLMYLEGQEVNRMTEYSDHAFAIPITIEWLYRLRFQKIAGNFEFTDGTTTIVVHNNEVFEVIEGQWKSYKHIKFVHQLQNLWYYLTGNELESL